MLGSLGNIKICEKINKKFFLITFNSQNNQMQQQEFISEDETYVVIPEEVLEIKQSNYKIEGIKPQKGIIVSDGSSLRLYYLDRDINYSVYLFYSFDSNGNLKLYIYDETSQYELQPRFIWIREEIDKDTFFRSVGVDRARNPNESFWSQVVERPDEIIQRVCATLGENKRVILEIEDGFFDNFFGRIENEVNERLRDQYYFIGKFWECINLNNDQRQKVLEFYNNLINLSLQEISDQNKFNFYLDIIKFIFSCSKFPYRVFQIKNPKDTTNKIIQILQNLNNENILSRVFALLFHIGGVLPQDCQNSIINTISGLGNNLENIIDSLKTRWRGKIDTKTISELVLVSDRELSNMILSITYVSTEEIFSEDFKRIAKLELCLRELTKKWIENKYGTIDRFIERERIRRDNPQWQEILEKYRLTWRFWENLYFINYSQILEILKNKNEFRRKQREIEELCNKLRRINELRNKVAHLHGYLSPEERKEIDDSIKLVNQLSNFHPQIQRNF